HGEIQCAGNRGDCVLQEGGQEGLRARSECLPGVRAEEISREVRQGLAEGRAGAHQRDQIATRVHACHPEPVDLDDRLPANGSLMTVSSLIARAPIVGRWLRRRAENAMVALLSVMFATFIVQIFARYVLNRPVGWSEEVIITAWLWTVLWGAAFVISEREEVRFDIIYSSLSERMRRIFTVITGIALIALYGISLPASYAYV